MKHCEGVGGICLVCCVYAHLVLRCVSLSSSGCAGSWFILRFVSLFHVGLCFNVGCLVFCVYRSLSVFVFWCLVMSSLVCAWSLIIHVLSVCCVFSSSFVWVG